MKVSTPVRKSRSDTRNKFDVAPLRALACLLATAGLLTACGWSGSGSTDESQVASAEAALKAADGRNDAGLNSDGTIDGSSAGSTVDANGQAVPAVPSATGLADNSQPAGSEPVSATINSVDTIISDMRLMNDTQLAGIPSNYG
jgi:hypothetical protein